MAEGDDDHEKHIILDRVDDAVSANAHPQATAALECFRAGWPRVFAEKRDRALDTRSILWVDLS
jgi:hypothetical protein